MRGQGTSGKRICDIFRKNDGEVIPIQKKGKNIHTVDGYRPITMLSNIGKIWERVMKRKLVEFIERIGLIPLNQSGFMKGRSTEQSLTVFASRMANCLNDKIPTISVSLDIWKAFDSVEESLLIAKLQSQGVDGQICSVLRNYMTNRRFRVKAGDKCSGWNFAKAVVPQGAVLAPILFIMFISVMSRSK